MEGVVVTNFAASKLQNMKSRVFAILASLSVTFSAFGQGRGPDLNLPDDPALADETKRRFARSVDEVMVKRWREAANAINWLMVNTPELYDGLYVNGYKAYEELYLAESDESRKKIYLDSMFISYKLKDKYFELNNREINNLAYRYYKYYKSDKTKYPEMKAAFDRAYEKPEVVINNNFVAYMDVYRRIFLTLKTVTEEEVLDVYTKINSEIDHRISQGRSADRLNRYKGAIDQMLTSVVKVDCEFISTKLYPELQKDSGNLKMAKKILQLGLTGKCSAEDFFLEAAIVVNDNEPTPTLTKLIARGYAAKKNVVEAENYFKQALFLVGEGGEEAAEIYMSMAKMFAVNQLKAGARDAAMNAMENDFKSSSAEAYNLIGDLYMGSFDDCKKQKSQIDDRAVFLLAHDMYAKAGNTKGMTAAKEQFPTIAQVFEQNKKEGDKLNVGCWIQRSTTIRTRASN